MEVTSKEQKRAEQLLQSQHIGLLQIKSFSFMKRYHQVQPCKKTNTCIDLHLKEGKKYTSASFRHPSFYLEEIPFDNFPTETYQRPSLYMFWFFVLFLVSLILGYYSVSGNVWWGFIPAIISFALSLFHQLMTPSVT